MKGIKRLAIMALAAAALGWTATAEAAPMLPKPFMFYSSSSNMVAFRQTVGFYMYFTQWRSTAPNWGVYNIQFASVVKGKTTQYLPLPTPWKLAKQNKGTGGWDSPKNPYCPAWPDVPEPTGLAAVGGAALLLGRRKREA